MRIGFVLLVRMRMAYLIDLTYKKHKIMKEFAKKISKNLTSSDFKGLYSKAGVINLLIGYGYPVKKDDINDNNWEEIYNILTVI